MCRAILLQNIEEIFYFKSQCAKIKVLYYMKCTGILRPHVFRLHERNLHSNQYRLKAYQKYIGYIYDIYANFILGDIKLEVMKRLTIKISTISKKKNHYTKCNIHVPICTIKNFGDWF